MIAAIFQGAALYIWTRSRLTFAFMAGAYVLLYAAAGTSYAEQGKIAFLFAVGFMWFTPFLLPPLIFIGSGTASTADLLTKNSMFPRHFFNLPVPARLLALPFMVYCAMFTALQWALACFIGKLYTLEAGGFWLPAMATSFVLWIQAIMWMSVRSRLARVAQLGGTLVTYVVVLLAVVGEDLPIPIVIVLSLAQLPLAYFLATRAVHQSRQGEANLIARRRELPPPVARKASRPMPDFASPLRAQAWMERQIHRWVGKGALIAIVPLLVLLLVAILIRGNPGSEGLQFLAQAGMTVLLVTLVILSISSGLGFAAFRKNARWQQADAFTMPAYFAALPFTTGDFAWTKLKAAAMNTAWLSAGVLLTCGVMAFASGFATSWLDQHEAWQRDYGLAGTLAIGVLPALLFVMLALSWTVNILWVGLYSTHRSALKTLVTTLVVCYAGLVATGPVLLGSPRGTITNIDQESLWLLVAIKVIALAALILRVRSKNLLSGARIAALVGLWGITVTAFAVYCAWHVPRVGLSDFPEALALGMWLSPVLGGVAAPLVLSFNRAR